MIDIGVGVERQPVVEPAALDARVLRRVLTVAVLAASTLLMLTPPAIALGALAGIIR